MLKWVSHNGNLLPDSEVSIELSNRAFRYGDALFETIRCNGNEPLLFEMHYRRLFRGLLALKMDVASLASREVMLDQIRILLSKNKCYKSSRLRLTVVRSGEGLYTPEQNTVDVYLEVTALSTAKYELNEKGLIVDVFTEMKKYPSPVTQNKTANSFLFILAGLYKKEMQFDDCLIINGDGKVIEAISSNLFWIKGNTLYAPSIASNCVDGIMRKYIIQLCEQNTNMQVVELLGTMPDVLLEADEVFLTNAIQGIQWVVGFREKRYFNKKVREISQLLNACVFS